jgi:hypothetical protein
MKTALKNPSANCLRKFKGLQLTFQVVLRLPAAEVALFYKLYHAVLLYTNQQFGLARQVTTIAQLRAMPEEAQYELRSAFYAHRQLLEAFVQENPQHFSAEELALVASWQHGVHGQFYVLRHLQRYTVFLDVNDPPKAYGVLALHDDFADLFPQVPRLIDTMLLPFHHQITYDGQCRYYNLVFGRGITRRLNDTYQLAQAHYGIITSLPVRKFVDSARTGSGIARPLREEGKGGAKQPFARLTRP